MAKRRGGRKHQDTYKYQFKVGQKIVHRGITIEPDRREVEHQQKWPDGHLTKIGRKTTRKAALEWERDGGKAERSRRKARG